MRYLLFFFTFVLFPITSFALESRCFSDYANIVADGSNHIFARTQNQSDLFFVQDGIMIPSVKKPVILRESFPYTLEANISSYPNNQSSVLVDDLNTTQIEITPLMSPSDLVLTLSFPNGLIKEEFEPHLDFLTQTSYRFEISDNGTTYVPINEGEISKYSFRYLRISFVKGVQTQSSIFLRTIRFDKKMNDILIIQPIHYGQIDVFRGWVCDANKLSALIAQRSSISESINTAIEVKNSIAVDFSPLPTTGKDTDSDTIIDMRDNCSSSPNTDQKDRNYDGIGDACSDDDGDTVFGLSDNCPTVRNPDQKDLNANRIGDACEFDTDDDTVSDGVDNCIHTKNPDQNDADSDGIGDVCDNCKLYNPDQLDFDKTNIGDVCEIVQQTQQKNDQDSDGVIDEGDNCREIANPDQGDNDGDGRGDLCDNCIGIKNPDQGDVNKNGVGELCEDADGDGVDGWRDNCPSVSNPDQLDSNNDGVGNLCSDTDNDGKYDEFDNCPGIYNADQKNIDRDTLGDACDEEDNRLLESNQTVFMIIFGLIACFFIGGIIFFLRKLKI